MTSPSELVELAESLGIDNLPPSMMMIIVRRLIAASTASSQKQGKALSDELSRLLKRLWSDLPTAARAAIRESETDTLGFKRAFAAGQVSFASAVAGQMSELRQSDDFRDAVVGKRYAKYIRALADSDRSGVELRHIVGVTDDATVSRRLSELRELGITDFRKDGRSIINFLTPAARGVYASWLRRNLDRDDDREELVVAAGKRTVREPATPHSSKRQLLNDLQSSIAPYLQRAQHVDSECDYA